MTDDSSATPPDDGETYIEFEGRVIGLTCDFRGERARDGRGFVVVEMDLEDVRRSPVYAQVRLVVPDHATHMGKRVAELMREAPKAGPS